MVQQTISLDVIKRDFSGTGSARRIRRDRMVPGVIYGDGKDPVLISVDARLLASQAKSGNFLSTLLELNVEGEVIRVIPKDVQYDCVRNDLIHVDFLRLGRGAIVTVEVPVDFINEDESHGLRRGGVLNIVRYTVEVSCPAREIPERIIADLSGLDIGDSLHISSVALPEGVSPTITDRDFTIATIAKPAGLKTEEEDKEEVEGEGEDSSEEAEK